MFHIEQGFKRGQGCWCNGCVSGIHYLDMEMLLGEGRGLQNKGRGTMRCDWDRLDLGSKQLNSFPSPLVGISSSPIMVVERSSQGATSYATLVRRGFPNGGLSIT